MKAVVAFASLVSLVGRCGGFDVPGGIDDPWHGHDHGHGHGQHPSDDLCEAEDDAGTPNLDCGPPGLYRDHSLQHLATGVVRYTPRYELWADGAEKERFIYLPEDAKIDTTNPDRWTFPLHTRIYKTFSLNGVKLETRRFEKIAPEPAFESWIVEAYVWSEDQRSIKLADPAGEGDVLGTDHDVPSQAQCKQCHAQPGSDLVNGFEAIQLNHGGTGWTLQRLIETGRLAYPKPDQPNVTLDNAVIPGGELAQDGLGYLNANCGICHRGPQSSLKLKFDLRVTVGSLRPSDAGANQLAKSCAPLTSWTGHDTKYDHYGNYVYAIDPGSSPTSAIIARMSARAAASDPEDHGQRLSKDQMPKIATEVPDEQGIEAVSNWIDQLDFECPLPAMP